MRKNMIIAALAAALITRECPWFNAGPWDEQAAIWLGLSISLYFFDLFWQEIRKIWRKRRARLKRMERTFHRITSIRRAV